MLQNSITKKIRKNSLFGVQLLFLKKNKFNHKKKYDLIIYNRKHSNKNQTTNLNFINNKKLLKYNILILGEKIIKKNIKNLGFISNVKLVKYLKKTRYAIISEENLYSFFLFDAIFSGSTPLVSNREFLKSKFIKIHKKNLINFQNSTFGAEQIIHNLNFKKKKIIKINLKKINLISKKFEKSLLKIFY